jgi:hypothetical protein
MFSPPCGYERIHLKLMISSPTHSFFRNALSPPLKSPQPPFPKGGRRGDYSFLLYSDVLLCQINFQHDYTDSKDDYTDLEENHKDAK